MFNAVLRQSYAATCDSMQYNTLMRSGCALLLCTTVVYVIVDVTMQQVSQCSNAKKYVLK